VALVDEPAYRLWHLQDTEFASPKASLYFQLLSPHAAATARDAALAALFARLVQDELNPLAYPATLAGLQYGIASTARGLTVRISGWDDRQGELLGHILDALGKTRFAEDRFANLKAELLRQWGNSQRERPFTQLADALETTLVAQNLSDLGPAELEQWAGTLREGATLEVLAHGNFRRAESLALGERIRAALGGTGEPAAPAIEVRELPPGQAAMNRAIDHPDSAALLYLQGRDAGRAERARIALAGQILGPRFFDELRTERQLGYAVFLQPMPLARVPGLIMIVQSPVAGPAALAREYEAFLGRQREALASLPEAEFRRHKEALAARLREVPGSLGEKTDRLWSDLGLGSFGFDDREQVAIEVERLDQAQWLRYFDEQLAGDGRRGLSLYTRGTAHAGEPLPEQRALRGAAKYYRFDWPRTVQGAGAALHL
jgi:secreted Zn-dependent insulinase-like peptidase